MWSGHYFPSIKGSKKTAVIETKPDFAAASQFGEVANEPTHYCPSSFSFNPINPVFQSAAGGLSQANVCHVNTLNDFIDFIRYECFY